MANVTIFVTGGQRGVSGGPFRGHQPLRHSRQEGDHYAQGHPAGQEDQGRARLSKWMARLLPIAT